MSQLVFDEKVVAHHEVLYRSRDNVRRRGLVYEALRAEPGHRVLDLGCGPGFYTLELLEQVGSEGAVVGVDVSAPALAAATARAAEQPNATFVESDLTDLPLEAAAFDRVMSVQTLEYVEDLGRALAEMHRVLRPGGRVVVWDLDWETVSWHSRDPERMRRMLAAWDEHLVHRSLPPRLPPGLRDAGFEDVRMEGHAFVSEDLSPDSYAGGALPVIERYLASRGTPDVEEWAAEQRELAERGELYLAHIQFCATGVKPG